MSVFHVTQENFKQEVLASKAPVLLDFWAPWCVPCKMISSVIDEISDENEDIKVCKVNIDEQSELAKEFKIMGIPALVLLKDGEAVATSVGVKSKSKIQKMLE